MKCPRCNGDGSIPYHIADDLFDETNCPLCGGSGEVMTEQEYLQTCNTEQLAEWLSEKLNYCQIMWYWACDKCTWSKKHESCMNDKEKWVEWLKQPHKDTK